MIIQFIGVLLAVIGFFTHLGWLFVVGGFMCLFMDIYGMTTGKLNPLVPIILYIGGFVIVKSWYGVLWGAAVGNLFDLFFTLLPILGFSLSRKKK